MMIRWCQSNWYWISTWIKNEYLLSSRATALSLIELVWGKTKHTEKVRGRKTSSFDSSVVRYDVIKIFCVVGESVALEVIKATYWQLQNSFRNYIVNQSSTHVWATTSWSKDANTHCKLKVVSLLTRLQVRCLLFSERLYFITINFIIKNAWLIYLGGSLIGVMFDSLFATFETSSINRWPNNFNVYAALRGP